MQERWRRIIAEWINKPVQVNSVELVREWSESKVARIAALVDGAERIYYGKLARSNFDTELAVCRLAGQTSFFPAPPGTSVEIDGETWLLLQEASGRQLARNQTPETYAAVFRSLATFHEQGLAEEIGGLPRLVDQVDTLSGTVFEQVQSAVSQGVFTEVDPPLLNQVRTSVVNAWPAVRLLVAAYPQALLHGDCHSGNLFLGENGQLCLIDWGSAMLGPGLLDIVGLVDVAERMRDPIGDVGYLLQLYWDGLSDASRRSYGGLREAWQVLRVCRAVLELGWFTQTEDDYGQRANRELQIISEALSTMGSIAAGL